MSASCTVTQDGETCLVSGSLDFLTTRSALDQLGPMVGDNKRLTINFGGVSRSNSAALALMVELQGIARRAGHDVSFDEVPGGLQQLAKVCQVDDLLSVGGPLS